VSWLLLLLLCFEADMPWGVARYDKLSSAIATRFAPAPITRIATKNQLVYAACGAEICVFKRQLLVSQLGAHDEPIMDMILLGDVLLTVCAGNVLKVRKYQAL
jgi:hypothetical protein